MGYIVQLTNVSCLPSQIVFRSKHNTSGIIYSTKKVKENVFEGLLHKNCYIS